MYSLLFIIIFNFSLNDFKEWFYEHKKYGIEDNFNQSELNYNFSENLTYKFTLKEEYKNDKNVDLFFEGIQAINKENELLQSKFTNLNQYHTINKKKFNNTKIKSLEKNIFKIEIKNKKIIFNTKNEYFDPIVNYVFDYFPSLPEKSIDVGSLWSEIYNSENTVFEKKYNYEFKNFIKFLGYKNGNIVLKNTIFLNITEKYFSTSKGKGFGESIITINNGIIENITINIDIDWSGEKPYKQKTEFVKILVK